MVPLKSYTREHFTPHPSPVSQVSNDAAGSLLYLPRTHSLIYRPAVYGGYDTAFIAKGM